MITGFGEIIYADDKIANQTNATEELKREEKIGVNDISIGIGIGINGATGVGVGSNNGVGLGLAIGQGETGIGVGNNGYGQGISVGGFNNNPVPQYGPTLPSGFRPIPAPYGYRPVLRPHYRPGPIPYYGNSYTTYSSGYVPPGSHLPGPLTGL